MKRTSFLMKLAALMVGAGLVVVLLLFLLLRARHGKALLMFLNAYHEGVTFRVPKSPTGAWRLIVDTEYGTIEPRNANIARDDVIISGRSLLLYEAGRP